MKARMVWKCSVVMGLIVLPVIGGCLQRASRAPRSTRVTIATQPAPAPATQPAAETEEAIADVADFDNVSDAAVTPISQDRPLPGDVHLSPSAFKLVRLAMSGAEEKALLAFANKASEPFDLSADEIIYLNDIGVPSNVVAAMIERDQQLNEAGLAAAPNNTQIENPGPDWIGPLGAAPTQGPFGQAVLGNGLEGAFAIDSPPPAESLLASAPPEQEMSEEAPAPPGEFYDTLAPYGSWVDVDGYGQCWQPTVEVVNPKWTPYSDCGHWTYTDCGWFWASDYSWGWCPFHYGRWFRHAQLGWCWCPGSVWAPAWVCWRFNNQYCGWAPLPPRQHPATTHLASQTVHRPPGLHVAPLPMNSFLFVAWSHFHDHNLAHYKVPTLHVAPFFNGTTFVAGVTKTGGRIVNNGVPPNKVAAATGVRVQKAELITTVQSPNSAVQSPSSVVQSPMSKFQSPGALVTSGTLAAPAQNPPLQLKIVRPVESRPNPAQSPVTEMASAQSQRAPANSPAINRHSSISQSGGNANAGTATMEIGPGGELMIRGPAHSHSGASAYSQGAAYPGGSFYSESTPMPRGNHSAELPWQPPQGAWGHNEAELARNPAQHGVLPFGQGVHDSNEQWQPAHNGFSHEANAHHAEVESPHYAPAHEFHSHSEPAPVHEAQHSSPPPESSHHSDSSSSHSSSSASSSSSSSSSSSGSHSR